jgi:hypothetical protein
MNKDGGQAFPCYTGSSAGSTIPGLTMRDWFAGLAIVGIIACKAPFDEVARLAYAQADAMLAEREAGPSL